MSESFRPSKQFIIRGSVAIAIVAIILIVQTDWFRAIFHKKPIEPAVAPQTVGDIVGTDTNKNGIPDWEEKLWGLDPTVLYTNGVPNKQIIDQKKQALGLKTDSNTTDGNETDDLAQQLLTITTALGQSGQVTDADIQTIATKLADSVEFQNESMHYSLKDLQTVQTTTASLQAYYKAVAAVAAKYDTGAADIDVVITALENNDTSGLSALKDTKDWYQQYARALVATKVPVGIENYHLDMTNDVYGISVAIGYLSELPENGANALTGVALYKIYDQKLTAALTNIKNYLTRYGILNQ